MSKLDLKQLTIKQYKYITIVHNKTETFNDRPVYRIFNTKAKVQIAVISYYKPWKQYVFSSHEQCVFNNTCLRDILEFMENDINVTKRQNNNAAR